MTQAEVTARDLAETMPELQKFSLEKRKSPGAFIRRRELVTIIGETIVLPDPECYVHLQFRRFAGCPICDLHLRSFALRQNEVVGAGVREIVVFHSPAEELKAHAAGLPLAVIADPQKRLYAEFAVKSSVWSLLDPRVWPAFVWAVFLRLWEMIRGRRSAPSLHMMGGRLGLPADFLIASSGTVIASKYGVHAYDQWSVDELLELMASQKSPPSPRKHRQPAGQRTVPFRRKGDRLCHL